MEWITRNPDDSTIHPTPYNQPNGEPNYLFIDAWASKYGQNQMAQAAQEANDQNVALNRENREFNAQEAQKDRDFQERMANTAYQRQAADMLKAGLNPILGAFKGNGAAVPGGASASSSAAEVSPRVTQNPFTGLAQTALSASELKQSMKKYELDAERLHDLDMKNAVYDNAMKAAQAGAATASAKAAIASSANQYAQAETARKHGKFLDEQRRGQQLHNDDYAMWTGSKNKFIDELIKGVTGNGLYGTAGEVGSELGAGLYDIINWAISYGDDALKDVLGGAYRG